AWLRSLAPSSTSCEASPKVASSISSSTQLTPGQSATRSGSCRSPGRSSETVCCTRTRVRASSFGPGLGKVWRDSRRRTTAGRSGVLPAARTMAPMTATPLFVPEVLEPLNPATLQPVGAVPVTDPEAIADAVSDAQRAQRDWGKQPLGARSRLLRAAAAVLLE